MKKIVNLTADGKKSLEKELADLIAERPAIAERIATARAFGDLSENEEYSSARNEQKLAESRILEIQDILKNAQVIKVGKKSKVVLGAVVNSLTQSSAQPKQTHSKEKFPTNPQSAKQFLAAKLANQPNSTVKNSTFSKLPNPLLLRMINFS